MINTGIKIKDWYDIKKIISVPRTTCLDIIALVLSSLYLDVSAEYFFHKQLLVNLPTKKEMLMPPLFENFEVTLPAYGPNDFASAIEILLV